MSYTAPVKDMLFNMQHLANLDEIARIPGFEDAGLDTAQAVLEECARFNQDVVAPLNWESDKQPSSWKDGVVSTSPGFKQAYQQYAQGGWQGLQHPFVLGLALVLQTCWGHHQLHALGHPPSLRSSITFTPGALRSSSRADNCTGNAIAISNPRECNFKRRESKPLSRHRNSFNDTR